MATTTVWDDVLALNPWLGNMGITAAQMKQINAQAAGPSQALQMLRALPQVKRRTQAMYRQDGTPRFATEGELFRWEDDVRAVLRQAGVNVERDYSSPGSLIGYAEKDLSPDEIRDRLAAWKGVKEAAPRAREIFYVYGGLTPSDDDLYEAVVDPAAAQRFNSAANRAIAEKFAGPGAWQGWIDRARQAGQARIVKLYEDANRQGSTIGAAIQRTINIDPAFANQIMETVYSGGDPENAGGFLDLTSLLDAYEFMAVGAAAEGAGMELPTLDRLKEIRAAGIQRSQAIDAYQQFGMNRERLNAAVLRARGQTFTQTDFEQAEFFNDANARRELEAGEAYMRAAGQSSGQFAFQRGQRGQFVQSGLSTY